MSEAKKQWNPNDVVETVKDRIRDQFVSLIPEDVFRKMVQTEIAEFMSSRERRYNSERQLSPLQETIISELMAAAKEEVMKLINDPASDWKAFWNGNSGKEEAGKNIKKFMLENSAEIIERTIGGMFQRVLGNMQR